MKALAASCLAACSLSVSGFVVTPGTAGAVAAARAGAGLVTAGRKGEVTKAAGVGRRQNMLMRYVSICIYVCVARKDVSLESGDVVDWWLDAA